VREIEEVRRSEVDQSAGLYVLEAVGSATRVETDKSGVGITAARTTDVSRDVTVGKPQRHGSGVDFLHHTKTPKVRAGADAEIYEHVRSGVRELLVFAIKDRVTQRMPALAQTTLDVVSVTRSEAQ